MKKIDVTTTSACETYQNRMPLAVSYADFNFGKREGYIYFTGKHLHLHIVGEPTHVRIDIIPIVAACLSALFDSKE